MESLFLTTKSRRVPSTHLINLKRMKRFEQTMEPPSCFELKTPKEIKDFGKGSEN